MSDLTDLLKRGTAEIIEEKSLLSKLKSGKKLRVKFGIDPTGPDIHLGHTIPLIKLRQFQDLGHKAVLIIGDYTALIGDPSGKDETRPPLSLEEVKANAKGYLDQAFRILDKKKTEVRHNSEWLGTMSIREIYALSSKVTFQQIMAHETFSKRVKKDEAGLTMLEMLYPLMQGYDSVVVKADVELGGADQKFNLLMGRQIQERFGQPKQDVVMVKYLHGTDGKEKMSKSLKNDIALNDPPNEMFGKVMSIPDNLIAEYTELLTDLSTSKKKKGAAARKAKAELAHAIVARFYGSSEARAAETAFNKVFKAGALPDDMPTYKTAIMSCALLDVLVMTGLVLSKSEARRMIEQGAVKIDGLPVKETDERIIIQGGEVIQVGKRRFVRLSVSS